MSISKTHQSGDWDFVEAGVTVVLDKKVKAVRIDQEGTATITPEGMTVKPEGNYLQGEVLNIQGKLTLTTGTARLQVMY